MPSAAQRASSNPAQAQRASVSLMPARLNSRIDLTASRDVVKAGKAAPTAMRLSGTARTPVAYLRRGSVKGRRQRGSGVTGAAPCSANSKGREPWRHHPAAWCGVAGRRQRLGGRQASHTHVHKKVGPAAVVALQAVGGEHSTGVCTACQALMSIVGSSATQLLPHRQQPSALPPRLTKYMHLRPCTGSCAPSSLSR